MKLLYISSERSRAHVAARAVRTVFPHATVLWASGHERAAFGILENPDLAALIVEVQSDSHGCSYLKHLQQLGVNAPIIMVVPEGAGPPLESLETGAQGYVAKGPSFSRELPAVVTRTIEAAREPGALRRDHLRSETFAKSAVDVRRQPFDAPAIASRTSHQNVDARPKDAVGNTSTLERRVSDLEALFHQRQQSWGVEQSAAAERQAELTTLLNQEGEIRTGLEQKLADAKVALQDAEQRLASASAAAAAQLAERQAQYETGMAQAAAMREMLEGQLRESRTGHRTALADVERLSQREAELSSMLTEASAAANEHRTNDQRSAAEQAAAREAELQAQLERELEQRRNAEDHLSRAKTALDDAEKQRASAVTVATALLAKRQAQFDAELVKAAEARDLQEALDEARQTVHAHAAIVEEFTQRETALKSQLDEAAATRRTLTQQLADAARELQDARERAARDRLAAETRAAEREAALDGLIHQERATREDVEQELAQVEAALAAARRDYAAAVKEVERFVEREAAFSAQLDEAAAIRRTLERQVTDAAKALQDAQEAASRDRLTAETRAAEREAALDGLIHQERAIRGDVEEQLAHVEAALAATKQQHTLAMAAAAAEQAESEAQFEIELSQTAARRDEFEQRFIDADTALAEAKQQHASALAAAEARSAERVAALDGVIHQERARRGVVEQQLAQVEAALAAAKQQHASAIAAAIKDVERLADRETALTTQLADAAEREAALDGVMRQERAMRGDVEQQLAQVEAAFAAAKQQHAAAMAAAATERAERQTQFETELSQTAARRDEFKQRFADAEAARAAARRDHAAAVKEVERLADRETVLTTQLADAAEREAALDGVMRQERAMRADVAQQLAQVEAALAAAKQQHAAAMAAAAAERAEREAVLDGVIHQERAMRGDVEQQLAQVEAALAAAKQQHAAAMAAAEAEIAERQAQFEIQLSQTALRRDEFKQRFTDAEAARAAARRDHAAAVKEVARLAERETVLMTQLTETAERETALDGLLHQERAIRADVEEQLEMETAQREALTRAVADLRAAAADADQRFRAEIAGLTARARDEVAHLESQSAREREDHAERQADLLSEIRDLEAARDALDESLASVREQSRRREMDHHNERDGLERARLTAEGEIRRLAAERIETHHQLEEARRDFQETLDRISTEHAEALAKLVTAVGERDALIEEQAARHAASLEAAEHHRSQLQERFHTTLTGRAREIERLQDTLDRTNKELAGARKRCEVLQTEANRVQPLENQLEESRSALRRQFQDAPLAWCRFTRDGVLTQTNRALADLAGYRKLDELRGDDFVKTVFESASDLSWLIERCLSTKRRQSIDTAWKRRNGDRLLVRLSGRESAPDVVEIAVQDITTLRALEDRVGQAHRMEAVGRLASEIAVTCGRMLQDAYEDGRRWLTAVGEDEALRHRAELLLDEVTRAASYLQQLAAYGDEQTSALQPVELNRVLRNLKPVLKHVAGDDVDLELSKVSSPLNVDMRADRVERLLVNLASYGRERMPSGGRLKIELATVFVDQSFIADHPAVRRGSHALITVTAMRRDMPAPGLLQLQTGPTDPRPNDVALQRPGVELGPLQELLRQCGGHLWMTADPPGNMVAKIRVPLRVTDDRRAQPRRIFRPVARA